MVAEEIELAKERGFTGALRKFSSKVQTNKATRFLDSTSMTKSEAEEHGAAGPFVPPSISHIVASHHQQSFGNIPSPSWCPSLNGSEKVLGSKPEPASKTKPFEFQRQTEKQHRQRSKNPQEDRQSILNHNHMQGTVTSGDFLANGSLGMLGLEQRQNIQVQPRTYDPGETSVSSASRSYISATRNLNV